MYDVSRHSQQSHPRGRGMAASNRGTSLVEVIIVSALIVLVFGGLFSGLQLMINIISNSKAEAGARSLAVERLEFIRALPYDQVGTIGGLGPQGNIPQTSTTTLNGIEYTERVFIAYLDRPEDGFGAADSNGIDQDSKVIKVEYTWNVRGENKSLALVSDVVPRGIESTAGGGTLRINVFDAAVQPVAGAEVRIVNTSIATTTDVTVLTNASGMANFPGAPAGAGYQITVTKPGYSTDQTYSASATNTSPNPPHVAVVESLTSTVNFAIDLLSDLTLRTISTPITGVFSDSFSSSAAVGSTTDVVVSGGALVLAGSGSYASVGTAFATTTEPSTITSWQAMDFNGTTTANSEFRVRLYEVTLVGTTTTYTLIPDAVLPNNSTGFILGPIDITSVDPATYPALALGVTLSTSDSSETPELYDWSLTHVEAESPVSGVTIDIVGSKSIGDVGGSLVRKYSTSGTTNGAGEIVLTDLEWDQYTITIDGGTEGYDISEAYAPLPYALVPNVSETLTLVLRPHSVDSLRVTVVDTAGAAVGGATVNVQNAGTNETLETSIYGQAFFDTLPKATDYTLTVSAPGYDTSEQTNFTASGTTQTRVILAAEGTGGSTPPPPATSTVSNFYPGYTNRIPLSIAGTSLFGSVSDFPVYVDLSDLPAAFFTAVQNNGGDIRVTLGDGQTEVPRQVVAIDRGAQTGELHFLAPSLDISTTTRFYLYYGSSTAMTYTDAHPFGGWNVWQNDYLAVYHLEESVTGSGNADVYRDSTSNNAHGDDFIQATNKNGVVGRGQRFSAGSTDFIELPHTVLNGETDVTLTFWYQSDNTDYRTILSGARDNTSDGANEFLAWFASQAQMDFFAHGNPRVSFGISNMNDNVWRHYAMVRNDTSNQVLLYINGAADNENPETRTMTTLSIAPGGLFIGVDQDSIGGGFGQYLDDNLDEVRISRGVRPQSWIANEYSNQNFPSLFYSVGTIETE